MDDMKLDNTKVCPFAHRRRSALDQKSGGYTRFHIDLRNKPPWYRDSRGTLLDVSPKHSGS
jgi:hypothetical protein